MATVYKVDMKIVSAFVNYNEEELERKLGNIIENWRDIETGLGLESIDIKVTKVK